MVTKKKSILEVLQETHQETDFTTILNYIDKTDLLNKTDLMNEETTKKIVKEFSKTKNCEVLTLSTIKKESISKIKAKLISYVS